MMMYGGGDKPKKNGKTKGTKCRKVKGKMVCTPKKVKFNKKTGKYS